MHGDGPAAYHCLRIGNHPHKLMQRGVVTESAIKQSAHLGMMLDRSVRSVARHTRGPSGGVFALFNNCWFGVPACDALLPQ
jgi:hypothetical protein